MNKFLATRTFLPILIIGVLGCRIEPTGSEITPNRVIPTQNQVAYQEMELVGFIHLTVNTFTNKEWGFGDEQPSIFNPTELDAEQWVLTAKAGGMKQLILTAKHHDGFCLWPSKHTEHSIKNSPYKNGKGDIVAEFVEACRKYGLKVGLYLSPWDRNHKDYGKPAYVQYYKDQLKELLTQYGEINEIWFDGANGGDGYYGGTNEKRKIDSKSYYGWEDIFHLVKELQPNIKIFSDAGSDVHWIGNENGIAGATFWSTISKDRLTIGTSETDYLNNGDPNGDDWIVGQCDVSIRPGWFYHASEDSLVKSPQQLVDIYYKSVGRNAVLLINLPPDQRGLIHENDVEALMGFWNTIEETFSNNLTKGSKVKANNTRLNNKKFEPANLLDNNPSSYWATDEKISPAHIELEFLKETNFDRILIQEPIQFGQRINKFAIDIWNKDGWTTVFEGTTIGYKRLVRINPVTTEKMRLRIIEANNTVALSNLGLFKSSQKESDRL
ncbi:MAG: alpha-L-fucosidase [Breznakibacter sp.]|nr:alpha-L-fucosidase [Breznakibacter sp.]